ncbi:hypothetical protein EGC77_11410 [Shewanella psychromarinicola]|uniref:Uncharacterized protein n=1 Tax=Shewanella psychromarinicola TaxID=2487742 RepID=A0A3N4E5P7_9GAMM|nr:hypothetical protein EGC77_11410 [Shewanella psychromarinicola]
MVLLAIDSFEHVNEPCYQQKRKDTFNIIFGLKPVIHNLVKPYTLRRGSYLRFIILSQVTTFTTLASF